MQCAERIPFNPVSRPNTIEWSKFPEFKLPFTIIFGGPRVDTLGQPLKRGFTAFSSFKPTEALSEEQRAIEWHGIAYGLKQPWETLESPWGNDTAAYHREWDKYLNTLANGRKNPKGLWLVPGRLLMVDIERVHETDDRILQLKSNTLTPEIYRRLADAEFIAQYKKDMVTLYAETIRYIRRKADLTNVKVSTYSDVPIRNTWFNIIGNTWQDWTTNAGRVSFLVKDPVTNKVGGAFYQQLDFLSPSAYYYYDYPSPLAGDYLAYMLFQIEANRAWSDKPVIPFVWMRYHECCGSGGKYIQPHMAEATAVFPFFAGAKGLWLWDGVAGPQDAPYGIYEHFIHGLYRLSRFADMFEGTYELISDKPARDHMEQQTPIWRGVLKNNQLLVAAQNPYAGENQKTEVTVAYKNQKFILSLTGREVYLCKFDLSVLGVENPAPFTDLRVYPNPAHTSATLEFTTPTGRRADLQLINLNGQTVKSLPIQTSAGLNRFTLQLHELPKGVYLIRISDGNVEAQKKLLKN
ncbi:T9SS type A sorting domain-containing protein [Larkinella soli]|uniref:T9SS type A sorting domain-containing protein n=1 Tax=Larkinella soli TaxID=1770527 RepID=UPI001E484233|nr:T9SS type A sorting domain-containing protein [Larkinella soli]